MAHVARVGVLVALSAFATAGAAGCRAETPIEHAERLVRAEKADEAAALLMEHLARSPDDVPARRLLVRVHAWAGDFGAAQRDVDELARRLPNDPTPWIELGHAYELTHRFDEALAAYDRAADVAPRSPKGPREGGMRAARWGEVDAALPRLEEARRRGARDADTLHALGLVRLHAGDPDGAARAYEEGVAADPSRAENLLGLASVAVVKNDAEGALRAYDRLLARLPRHAPAELGRAWALASLGRRADAERALDHALALGASPAVVEKQRRRLAIPRGALAPSDARDAREDAHEGARGGAGAEADASAGAVENAAP